MKIHFLDVGPEKYGDCILIEHGQRFILVDGAHSGNYRAQGITPSLQDQLAKWMGPPPFKPDLLIVTHVHGDHIGCLPQLVRDRLLQPKRVLAADERWGSGRTGDTDADPLSDADPGTRLIAEALQEEAAAAIESEDEARAFIDAFVSEESRYTTMLETFDPAIVLRFGRDDVAPLEKAFKTFDLKFLGPSVAHLKTCAAFIGQSKAKVRRRPGDALAPDAEGDLGARFWAELRAVRSAVDDAEGLVDAGGPGSGKNNQSIVFAVGRGAKKVLLAGDMQFAAPDVPGLRDEMNALLQAVVAHGPYCLIKVTHHTAKNGLSGKELDALGGEPILVHTGGLYDPAHPNRRILELFAQRLAPQRFARTDRNGIVSVNLSGPKPEVALQRGAWNNFELNPEPPKPPARPRRPDEEKALVAPRVTVERGSADTIEVIARIPHQATRVMITVDVQPNGETSTVVVPPAQKKTVNGT